MRRLILVLGLLVLPAVGLADTDAGVKAYLNEDWPRAVRELLTGAKDGEVEALYWLGAFYSNDHPSFPKDINRAFTYYRRAAEKGHPTAELIIAYAYERGEGVQPNEAESLRWFRLAAEDCIPGALEWLAQRYQSGLGVPEDLEKAKALIVSAAQNGQCPSKYAPDTIRTAVARKALAQGDFDLAAAKFMELAERGVTSAQLNLAFLYLQGHGVRKDLAETIRWLRLAAEHDSVAAYSLAELHLRGVAAPRDISRAERLLKHAVYLGMCCGVAEAHYLLAAIYGRGYLGHPDYQQAVDIIQSIPPNIFTEPPSEPHPDLPLMGLLPRVGPVSRAEWRSWLAHAGRSGHLQAQMTLGMIYEFGVDYGPAENFVRKDLGQAYFWYSLAAAQRDLLAKQVLQRLAIKIGPGDRQRARQMLDEFKQRKSRS